MEKLEGAAIRFEAEQAGRELDFLTADGAAESGIAVGGVDPIVEAITEVRNASVSVVGFKSGEQDLADVGVVVAVGVLEKNHVGAVGADETAVDEDGGGGDGKLVSEEGEFVGLAVAVGVLADVNAVVAEISRLEVVRIVHGLDDVGAATVVPSDIDGVDDVWLAGKEGNVEAVRDLCELEGIGG